MGPPDLQQYALFGKMDPNKSCKGHEGLSFGDFELDLELDFEGQLKVNIEFLIGNLLF